jgi:hypothetical protein
MMKIRILGGIDNIDVGGVEYVIEGLSPEINKINVENKKSKW